MALERQEHTQKTYNSRWDKCSGPNKHVLANPTSSVILLWVIKHPEMDSKGPEDINYTAVKYGATLYGRVIAM